MTIERLETIAANLYKEAEEATPIIGGADKLDWMARRLEDIIEGKDDGLINDYLNCETTDQVEALLEAEYNDFKDTDDEHDDLVEDEVALSGTEADLNEDTILREERLTEPVNNKQKETDDYYKTDDVQKRSEKETGIKDELPDAYANDRADQPEFIGRDPEYFEDQPVVIIEEEIIIVDDTSEGSNLKESGLTDTPPKCGENA